MKRWWIGSIFVLLSVLLWPSKEPIKRLTLYGNVDIREVDLGFRVFGKVQNLYREEGDVVQEGEMLAELDALPYQEMLSQARAEVELTRIVCDNRALQLSRRSHALQTHAVSEETMSDAQAALQESKAAVEIARARLAQAETALNDAKLFAPSKGTILSRIKEPGSIVQAGEPIYTLSLQQPIWVRAYISEKELGKVCPGMKALVYTDSLPVYEGQVGFISSVAEFTPKTVETLDLRTELVFRLRIVIDTLDCHLRQGMPVTVVLDMP